MSTERKNSEGPAGKLSRDTRETASKGRKSVERSGGVATEETAAAGGQAKTSIESGRRAAVAASEKCAAAAGTVWTAVKNRKVVAAGAGAGLIGIVSAAFAAGRATARPRTGPLTRLAHGRI
ncbi:hypothetical protein [Streptomyces sp. NPDC048650]|uniref:hypothetical protein n=1 Tax=unclassified Streptomyces TaxID=2593676 RepID=UPI00371DF513